MLTCTIKVATLASVDSVELKDNTETNWKDIRQKMIQNEVLGQN